MGNEIENKKNMQECRNCKYEVEKGIRRCEACGILNPTVTISEVVKTIAIVLAVMGVYTFITKL